MSRMKSSLLSCLPSTSGPGLSPAAKEASVVLCDMSAVIHMVKPHRAQMFGEYTQMHTCYHSWRARWPSTLQD